VTSSRMQRRSEIDQLETSNGWMSAAAVMSLSAHPGTNARPAIIASVHLGLSNSRLEGINAKIRVIQRRGYGHPDPDSLTAMIYLCLGGITITLPTQR